MVDVRQIAKAARKASREVSRLSGKTRSAVIESLSERINARAGEVLAANREDVEESTKAGLSEAKQQRLRLTEQSVRQIAAGLKQVASLPDPVGQVTRDAKVQSGLRVTKVRSPLGVIAMIYEARPGVTVDAFALCFKAGNACILRGGKEAQRTNAALTAMAHEALEAHGVSTDAMANLSGSGRETLETLLTLSGEIDLVIPRGGVELIRYVHERSRIPTVQHFQGVCHVFVDESADVSQAMTICKTAKTSAPATCNALECVLVHKNIADRFVPEMVQSFQEAGVEVRGSPLVGALAANVQPAAAEDFGREFLDLVVAMRVVGDVDEAIAHINAYGSNHTEAILTRDVGPGGSAEKFVREVGSSCVLVNASTRFNDGFQLGLGAEIGISTSRVHAYGPMGLEELTTQRWVVYGDGQAR